MRYYRRSSSESSEQQLMWALTLLWTVFLVRYLPNVSWLTPGSAGRFRALFWALVFGATYIAWRLRNWPIVIGGVGLVWLTFISAHADIPGG